MPKVSLPVTLGKWLYISIALQYSISDTVYLTHLLLRSATDLKMEELKKIPWFFDRKQLPVWVQGENGSPTGLET